MDTFFATTTEHTFQGTRYYGHQGGIGYEIFSGFKTKKKFIVKVKGRESGDRWSYTLKSDGEMSVIEHLSKGLKGTRGNKKWKRKCEMKLGDSVPVRSAIAAKNIQKNLSIAKKQRDDSDEKVKKLEKEILKLKKQEKDQKISKEKRLLEELKQKIAEEKKKIKELNKQIE